MAQFSSPRRPFDLEWGNCRARAIKILLDMEDHWLQSEAEFPSREAAAVLVRIFSRRSDFRQFATRFPDSALYRASADDWLAVIESLETEIANLAPKATSLDLVAVGDRLTGILCAAARSWETNGPGEPPVECVVDDLLNQLAAERLVTVQYG